MLLRYTKERRRNLLAKPGKHQFMLVLDRLKPSYNVAKIFRSAEAFGARAVHLIDIGPFDPAPAKGSLRKVPATFHEHFSTCYHGLTEKGYTFFVLKPEGSVLLGEQSLPAKTVFVLGHEEFGQSFDNNDYSGLQILRIPQCGDVQSLNVSIAASVAMYEYVRQHQKRDSQ